MAQLHCRRASRRVYRRRRRAAETGIGVQERLWRPAVMAAIGLILGFGRKPRKICVRGSLEEQKEHQNPHTLKRSCEETKGLVRPSLDSPDRIDGMRLRRAGPSFSLAVYAATNWRKRIHCCRL